MEPAEKACSQYLEKIWDRPDRGMWEVRGEPRQFTFSKIMCWVAFDRAIKSVEQYGLQGPCEHWRKHPQHDMPADPRQRI